MLATVHSGPEQPVMLALARRQSFNPREALGYLNCTVEFSCDLRIKKPTFNPSHSSRTNSTTSSLTDDNSPSLWSLDRDAFKDCRKPRNQRLFSSLFDL